MLSKLYLKWAKRTRQKKKGYNASNYEFTAKVIDSQADETDSGAGYRSILIKV